MRFGAAVAAYTRWTGDLRAAYLRTVPARVLRVLDPPLRRTLMAARQVAATPLYLRQQVSEWSGRCGDAPTRVALWGKPSSPSHMLDFFFDGDREGGWREPVGLPALLRDIDGFGAEGDLVLAETTPTLAHQFTRRGFMITPDRVRVGADVSALRATLARPPSALAADLERIRRHGFRSALWSYTRARSEIVHRDYLRPHADARFGSASILSDFGPLDRLFAAGFVVTVGRPTSPDPDALGIVIPRGHGLWFVALGTRHGDPALRHSRAVAALYEAVIRLADERGMRRVDAGRCFPWRADGVMAFKWKWGFRPTVDTSQTFEFAIKVLRPASAAARRLGERGVIVRDGARFGMIGADGRPGPIGREFTWLPPAPRP